MDSKYLLGGGALLLIVLMMALKSKTSGAAQLINVTPADQSALASVAAGEKVALAKENSNSFASYVQYLLGLKQLDANSETTRLNAETTRAVSQYALDAQKSLATIDSTTKIETARLTNDAAVKTAQAQSAAITEQAKAAVNIGLNNSLYNYQSALAGAQAQQSIAAAQAAAAAAAVKAQASAQKQNGLFSFLGSALNDLVPIIFNPQKNTNVIGNTNGGGLFGGSGGGLVYY